MWRKWTTFRRLSTFERRLLLQSLILLPVTTLGLRLCGFRRWQSVLMTFASGQLARAQGGEAEHVRVTARAVQLAATRGLSRPSCLPRSLVLWFLLRRQGIAADLRLGVRKQGQAMDAHAWVECAGLVVNDQSDVRDRFAPFETFSRVW